MLKLSFLIAMAVLLSINHAFHITNRIVTKQHKLTTTTVTSKGKFVPTMVVY